MSGSSFVIFIIVLMVTVSRTVLPSTVAFASNRTAEGEVMKEKNETNPCINGTLILGNDANIKSHLNETHFLDKRNITENTMISTSLCCTIKTNPISNLLTFTSPVCSLSPKIFFHEMNVTRENIASIVYWNKQNTKYGYHKDCIYSVEVRNFKNYSVIKEVISKVEDKNCSQDNFLNNNKLHENISEGKLDHRTFSFGIKETQIFSSPVHTIKNEKTESNQNECKNLSKESTIAINKTHIKVVYGHEKIGFEVDDTRNKSMEINSYLDTSRGFMNRCTSDIYDATRNYSFVKNNVTIKIDAQENTSCSMFIVDIGKPSTVLVERNRTFGEVNLGNTQLNDTNSEQIIHKTGAITSSIVDESDGDKTFGFKNDSLSTKIVSESIKIVVNSSNNHILDSANQSPDESSEHTEGPTCADTTLHIYYQKYPLMHAIKLRFFQLNKTRHLNETSSKNKTSYLKNSIFFKAIKKILGNVKGNLNDYVGRNATRFVFRRRRGSSYSSSVAKVSERTRVSWDAKKSTKYSKRFLRLLHRRRPDLWTMFQKSPTTSFSTTRHASHFMFPDIDEHGSMKWKPVTFTLSRGHRWKHRFEEWFFKNQDYDIVPHQELIAFFTDVYHVMRRTGTSLPPWMFTHSDNTHFIFLRRHGKKSIYSPKRDRKRNPPVTELRTTLSKWQKIGRLVYNYFWTTQARTTQNTDPPLESLIDVSHYWPHWELTRKRSRSTQKRISLHTEGPSVIYYDEWR